MNTKSRLILVDGSAYIFRAYYGLPPMNRADGTPINAVFGFTNMLAKLIEDYNNDKMIVIFDAARENFRNQIYSESENIEVLKFLKFSGNSFRQIFGDGYLRPFELATFRLNNMNEIIKNWGDYILHEKYLPQRGASFLLNDKNQVIYEFFSSDVLGYSSNMRDPVGFLSDLIKE